MLGGVPGPNLRVELNHSERKASGANIGEIARERKRRLGRLDDTLIE